MSGREAKRRITLENHEKATAAVECRKDEEVLDESQAAYKDIDKVMAAQADLMGIVHTLRMCCNFPKTAKERLVGSTESVSCGHPEQRVDELNQGR